MIMGLEWTSVAKERSKESTHTRNHDCKVDLHIEVGSVQLWIWMRPVFIAEFYVRVDEPNEKRVVQAEEE